MSKDEELKSRTEEVSLNREEIIFLETLYDQKEISGFKEFALDSMNQNELEFKGVKRRTKEELQNMMYTEKMSEWLEEAKKEETQRAMEFHNSVLTGNGSRILGQDDDSLQVLHTSDDDEVVTIRRQLMGQPRLSVPAVSS